MELLTHLITIGSLLSDACRNPEKLPEALISCGLFEGAVALSHVIFKAPGGIFLHHGKALLYYGILVAVVIFGFVEALVGIWVSGDLVRRRAAGKMILWVSIFPLIFVAALGL